MKENKDRDRRIQIRMCRHSIPRMRRWEMKAGSLPLLRVRGVWADLMPSSRVAMWSRNICTMQWRLVVTPAVSADWLRTASCASIFRASIRADERLTLSSCRGVFKGSPAGDGMHGDHNSLPLVTDQTKPSIKGRFLLLTGFVASAHKATPRRRELRRDSVCRRRLPQI